MLSMQAGDSLTDVEGCQCVHVVVCYRPVGSKFEMVRPYYDAMRARNVLGHTHLPSPPPPTPPGIPALECYCCQIAL